MYAPVGDITGDFFAAYVAKFGTPVAGTKIALSISPILATGQQGTAQNIIMTVQA